jgi:dienelactone hydrolase
MFARPAVAIAVTLACALSNAATAQTFHREELRVPMRGAGSRGLEAILIRPAAPGRYPLVLLNHGAPRDGAQRRKMSPNALLPQATEFARRGWAAVIVMRRGYGDSGGDYAESSGPCDNPNYVKSASASAADLRAAIVHLAARPDVDRPRIVSVGQSAGGLATVALTADPPSGLVAAINFAGGRGSRADHQVCRDERLVEAMRSFGRRSRVPMLWVYTENDHYFGPALARRMHDAFAGAGGQVQFVQAPPFGRDGHTLFASGIPQWTPTVDKFLQAQKLVLRGDLLPLPPLPAIEPPPNLSASGRTGFERYRAAPPHKAFAVSSKGAWAWRSGRRTVRDASEAALEACRERANDCRLVAVDDRAP